MGGITLQKLEVLYWVYHIGYAGLQTQTSKLRVAENPTIVRSTVNSQSSEIFFGTDRFW